MFRNFKIKNFRLFENLALNSLGKANLVTGRNGTGKTALLEAVFLNCGATNTNVALSISGFRGDSTISPALDRPFRSFFHKFKLTNTLELIGEWQAEQNRSPTIRNLTITPTIAAATAAFSSSSKEVVTGLEFTFKSGRARSKAKIGWFEQPVKSGPQAPTSIVFGAFSGPQTPTGLLPGRTAFGTQLLSEASPSALTAQPLSVFGPSAPASEVATSPGRSLNFVVENPPFSALLHATLVVARYYDVAAQIYMLLTQISKRRLVNQLVELMKIIDSRVHNILPLSEQGFQSIYVDIGGDELMPLSMMGAGFFNALNMAVTVLSTDRGVVLVDEIEDGIHYSAFPELMRGILEAAKRKDVQLFISTHSDEMITAFAEAAASLSFDDVAALRLIRDDEKIRVTRFGFSEIKDSREISLELR